MRKHLPGCLFTLGPSVVILAMIHACGGQDPDFDDSSFAGSGGQSSTAADASPVGVGGSAQPKPVAEHNPCTPMYCFSNGGKLSCLPTVCALLSTTRPSPVAGAH